MAIPTITPYSGGVANPDGSQTQTEFTQNMFDQLSYEAQLADELNATVNATNTTASEVASDAAIAQNSADAAQAAANFEGEFFVGVTNAEKGRSYSYNGEVWLCLQNTTTTPSQGAAEWKLSVGEQYVTNGDSQLAGGGIYPPSPNQTVSVGEVVTGYEILRVSGGLLSSITLCRLRRKDGSPTVPSGSVTSINTSTTPFDCTIGGDDYYLLDEKFYVEGETIVRSFFPHLDTNHTNIINAAFLDAAFTKKLKWGSYSYTYLGQLTPPTDVDLIGDARSTTLNIVNLAGSALRLENINGGSFEGATIVVDSDVGVSTYYFRGSSLKNIYLKGNCRRGYELEWTWDTVYERLRTNGCAITDECFYLGDEINGATFESLYTSNLSANAALVIDGNGKGNVINGVACQGARYGFWGKGSLPGGWTINGLYTENVIYPVRIGDYPNGRIFQGLTLNSPWLSGTSDDTRAGYTDRFYAIYWDNAVSVNIISPYIASLTNTGTRLTITGDGTTQARGWAVVDGSGVVIKCVVTFPGEGYTTANVSITDENGTGSGATATATIVDGEITDITLTNGGSGYTAEQTPMPFLFNYTRQCTMVSPRMSVVGSATPSVIEGLIGVVTGRNFQSSVKVSDTNSWDYGFQSFADLNPTSDSGANDCLITTYKTDGTIQNRPITLPTYSVPAN